MQSSGSLSSIASSASSNSSTYGSRTVLNIEELHTAAPRCRSSIVSFVNNDQTIFSPPSSPPPLPPPRRRQTQIPTLSSNKSMIKCRQLFRTCLASSTASPLQAKLSNADQRQEYFAKLCQKHRLLLVLTDYECQCGCRFTMEQGSYVILYESTNEMSVNNHGLVTVISSDLVCSKVPRKFLCDVELLRERVRCRRMQHNDELTFDL